MTAAVEAVCVELGITDIDAAARAAEVVQSMVSEVEQLSVEEEP